MLTSLPTSLDLGLVIYIYKRPRHEAQLPQQSSPPFVTHSPHAIVLLVPPDLVSNWAWASQEPGLKQLSMAQL